MPQITHVFATLLPSPHMGNVKKLPHRGKYWQTTEKGTEIPVPKRGAFFRDLEKASKPARTSEPDPEKPTN